MKKTSQKNGIARAGLMDKRERRAGGRETKEGSRIYGMPQGEKSRKLIGEAANFTDILLI